LIPSLKTQLRIGSRGSQLALWQANHIRALLEARGHTVEIEIIKTTGDKITDVALAKVGTKGMFTKEIEEALVDGRIDLAVHSLKDLPTEISPEFEIAAITRREDPRDVFCSQKHESLDDLPRGARVGTSSLRRQARAYCRGHVFSRRSGSACNRNSGWELRDRRTCEIS
jgi:hydroxymethylbilane synthase